MFYTNNHTVKLNNKLLLSHIIVYLILSGWIGYKLCVKTSDFGFCSKFCRSLWYLILPSLSLIENLEYMVFFLSAFLLKTWSYEGTTLGVATVVTAYLILVHMILPNFMKDRKPYRLKGTLLLYNIFQVVFSGYTVFLVSKNVSQ